MLTFLRKAAGPALPHPHLKSQVLLQSTAEPDSDMEAVRFTHAQRHHPHVLPSVHGTARRTVSLASSLLFSSSSEQSWVGRSAALGSIAQTRLRVSRSHQCRQLVILAVRDRDQVERIMGSRLREEGRIRRRVRARRLVVQPVLHLARLKHLTKVLEGLIKVKIMSLLRPEPLLQERSQHRQPEPQ